MTQSGWREKTTFKEWRWTHPDSAVVAKARVHMQEIKAAVWGRKTALDWDTYTEIENGFAVQWLDGATKKTAHQWLWQRVFLEALAGRGGVSERPWILSLDPIARRGISKG